MPISTKSPRPKGRPTQATNAATTALRAVRKRSGRRLAITKTGAGVGKAIVVPPAVYSILVRVLDAVAHGKEVTVHTATKEVTPNEAARLLNVSRPYVVGLIKHHTLPARLVGSHYRIPYDALMTYKAATDSRRDHLLDEFAELNQGIGMPYEAVLQHNPGARR